MRWVRLHPQNVAQKVQVIVEHFRHHVAWRLSGKAKAMAVTASRKEAVRYKLAMDSYIRAQGCRDVHALVAFSGEVMESEILAQQAAANQKTQFGESPDFMRAFEDAVIAAYENHKSLSEQVMTKGHVKKAMAAILLDLVYQGFEKRRRGA
jgi:hypothetical protein